MQIVILRTYICVHYFVVYYVSFSISVELFILVIFAYCSNET